MCVFIACPINVYGRFRHKYAPNAIICIHYSLPTYTDTDCLCYPMFVLITHSGLSETLYCIVIHDFLFDKQIHWIVLYGEWLCAFKVKCLLMVGQ